MSNSLSSPVSLLRLRLPALFSHKQTHPDFQPQAAFLKTLEVQVVNQMADPSFDPSLARPIETHLLAATQGVSSGDTFTPTTCEGGPNPVTYRFPYLQIPNISTEDAPQRKKGPTSKRTGASFRKRSGWNVFYREQFAIYHANNPTHTKQNARERKGFSFFASAMWKQLSPAQKEAYVQRAGQDDVIAVFRPVEKLHRKRAVLLDTLGHVVAELETDFGVESFVLWSERDLPHLSGGNVPPPPPMNVAEAYGIIGSTTGSRYIEVLGNAQLGPHQFTQFVQAHHPSRKDDTQPLIRPCKRKDSVPESRTADHSGLTSNGIDGQRKKRTHTTSTRDYHDIEFRHLLLGVLNSHLSPLAPKTRLPGGFFGPYLEKLGVELVGLPEKPVEIDENGRIGAWSADALKNNLEALRMNRVYIRRIDNTGGDAVDLMDGVEEESEGAEDGRDGTQEQEAAMILTDSAGGNRRGNRTAAK